jgi:transaldolase
LAQPAVANAKVSNAMPDRNHIIPALTICISYVDQNKAFAFCGAAQRYYRQIGARTQVLPASLTSIDEVLVLAGVDHITISPPLLTQLSNTPWHCDDYKSEIGSILATTEGDVHEDFAAILQDESAWRLAFTRCGRGTSEGKIVQAINIFYDMQINLEALIRKLDTIV